MKIEFNNSSVVINLNQKEFEKLEPLVISQAPDVNILSLTDEELYILRCITGAVERTGGSVSSLLGKLESEDLTCVDHEKVKFKKDAFNNDVIQFVEGMNDVVSF